MTDVTIPRILPCLFSNSRTLNTNVTTWRMSIISKGKYPNPITVNPPMIGIPKKASSPPDTHFKVVEVFNHSTSDKTIRSALNPTWYEKIGPSLCCIYIRMGEGEVSLFAKMFLH